MALACPSGAPILPESLLEMLSKSSFFMGFSFSVYQLFIPMRPTDESVDLSSLEILTGLTIYETSTRTRGVSVLVGRDSMAGDTRPWGQHGPALAWPLPCLGDC